ncbi:MULTISPECIES: rhodanese-like domain-containing protein [Myxococcus]|uniref:Rhodanese-like domain-containing protein n=1 Tax=Myxococcus llanfairpwllgwyngyllgogerychwyrndrobwllllantysiliogogogochensis TaxID=2590453 RepID=A0A540X5X3_9BACT|nr:MULTISPECIES: rhodanese-like domain-containing protein [Myxococcus]NTX05708.1 rhodanese-like domain-containing protein [Myxococcus sp. CA040A]NTX50174.1 rhodanese-like domain-containing protein [Myxococcus sp. CA039A]TQF16633.1 rhodanese-like domain-containing protein [Myxococcus llanfairpwllgwyngyllgogerychwyrndrobwllllantysiliogogogochensis]
MSHLFDSAHPQPAGYRDVDVRQLAAERPSGLHLVDVREPSELDGILGHLDGVRAAPLATVREAAALWPRDTEVLLICRSGARSARAATQLVELGFTRVMNLRGGMLAWNTEALPVVRLPSSATPTLAEVRDTLRARLPGVSDVEALPREPSRAELGAVLDALQATTPSGLVDTASFERTLREVRDLLAVARSGGASR